MSFALLQPTAAQADEAIWRLEQAKLADSTGFAERLRIMEKSKPLTTFLASDSRFDAKLPWVVRAPWPLPDL
jgi:hypothetical protein